MSKLTKEMNLNSNNPLISVVITTFNGERYLKQQIDSVLEQTYKNLEIIVLDDCSTDGTVEIISACIEKDNRITLIKNDNTLGYIKNFEKGFAIAKGEFIAPCDQDDIWLPNKIEVLLTNIENDVIAYCNSEIINGEGVSTGKKMSDVKRLIDYNNPLMFAIGNAAPGHAMLIRASFLKETFPYPTIIPHDYWLGFIATFNSKLKFVDSALVLYRQHNNNTFGVKATGVKRVKKKKRKAEEADWARKRMFLLYEKCPKEIEYKKVFEQINKTYNSFSLINNIKRVKLFYKYRNEILAYKHRSELRKILFCLKMFFKLV